MDFLSNAEQKQELSTILRYTDYSVMRDVYQIGNILSDLFPPLTERK